jgi:predicted ATP-dependent serine protease
MSMKNTYGEIRETGLLEMEAKELEEICFNRVISPL